MVGLQITKNKKICTIKFNRPERLNAVTPETYRNISDILKKVANDDDVNIVCITGEGKYFSSGNDLKESALRIANIRKGDPQKVGKRDASAFKDLVDGLIDFPKPLVCAVNGPAVGIGVTMLGLADLVYASDKATFMTPFAKLGIVPEACSSYTFPKIMGYAKANEVLLAGKKLTAQEALDCNLVSSVIPHHEFAEVVEKTLNYLATLPIKSLIYSKALIRQNERDILKKVNVEETLRVQERWSSEDVMNGIKEFFQRKSKL